MDCQTIKNVYMQALTNKKTDVKKKLQQQKEEEHKEFHSNYSDIFEFLSYLANKRRKYVLVKTGEVKIDYDLDTLCLPYYFGTYLMNKGFTIIDIKDHFIIKWSEKKN